MSRLSVFLWRCAGAGRGDRAHVQLRPSSPRAAVEKCSEETPPRRRLCPPDRGMRRHQRGCPRRRRRSEVPWDVSPGAESLRIKENPLATSGTFDAVGDISVRVGAFDAVGDSNPVPGCAGCPRPERRAPGRVECPRPHCAGLGEVVEAPFVGGVLSVGAGRGQCLCRASTVGSSDGCATQGRGFSAWDWMCSGAASWCRGAGDDW